MKKLSPSLIWRHQDSSGRTSGRRSTSNSILGTGRTPCVCPLGAGLEAGGLGGSLGQVRQGWATVCAGGPCGA